MTKVNTYATKKGVNGAVKRQAMHLMNYSVKYHDEAGSKGYTAVFEVDNREDFDEVRDRGFLAKFA